MPEVRKTQYRVIPAGAGERVPAVGSLQFSGDQTGGALEVIEYAGPAAPPPHVHREHDEVFYILKGKFQFVLARDAVEAGEGTLVWVPRGTRHGFAVEPGSRALFFVLPAGLAGFFRELGAGLSEGRSSTEIRARLAGRYDSYPEPA